jgi:cytochrome c oxidase subunit 2
MAVALIASMASMPALAEYAGTAHWGGFPTPVGPTGAIMTDVYNFMFWICVAVAIVVEGGLLVAIWKFRQSKNKKAQKFTHNFGLEVVWTVIPIFICIGILWKSMEAMVELRTMPEEGLTVEAIAYQFGWDFNYPDLEISAPEPEGTHELLSSAGVDRYVKDLIVPVNTNIKLHVTARDVIHAFHSTDLGVKIDAVPGRINYVWFRAEKTGDYIGQCAELCGSAHGEMFFNVKVVSMPAYLAWVNTQRREEGLPYLTSAKLAALSK